jgi:hypothetical protein
MRFLENGPDIPGDLLEARDQGSVVFFCGSGVSRAYAELPDFFGLAQDVLVELRVPDDSDAAVVFREARELGSRISVSGLLSADLVFGLLERSYTVADIRAAVARCIGRKIRKNLAAHQVLMRLAKTPAHRTQLVTTNFDRLFSDCDPSVANYVSPRLPQLTEFEPLNGIVYLHGRLNADYTDTEHNTVVLSSADFGLAYLSAGWAAEFFRELARKFTIVFVGYSGDDPPIRYMLEGINRSNSQQGTLFALQHNESEDSLAKWRNKGVAPIGFDSFKLLWATLEQWADRADNPSQWREKIVSLASQSPRGLKAYERGQVVQLVSSFDGAKEFLAAKPSSEWLCVFDPRIRFNRGIQAIDALHHETSESPFENYGLDSDPVPQFADKTQHKAAEIPPTLINVLEPNSIDLALIAEGLRSTTTIFTSKPVVPLSRRLQCLAEWIAQSAGEPATLWWVIRQPDLHPEIRGRLRWRISRSNPKLENAIAQRWSQLIDKLNTSDSEKGIGWYEFYEHIREYGWSYTALRLFGQIMRHTVEVHQPMLSSFVKLPPLNYNGITVDDVCRIELQIPQCQPNFDVPDEWTFATSQHLAHSIFQIELACNEFDCKHELDLCPIHIDPNPEIDGHHRITGVSGLVNFYVEIFTRLLATDSVRARASFLAWPSESLVFDRLRIWCFSNSTIVPAGDIYKILSSIDKELIWNSHTRRDLLVSLRERWSTIPALDKTSIEQFLLDGPPMWEQEDAADFDLRRKINISRILTWLQLQGCDLSSRTTEELKRIKSEVPEWSDSYADRAADSREARGGWVRTDTDFSGLQDLPVAEVIEAARLLAGRSTETFLVEKDPFTGYCKEYPVNALEALKLESGKGKCAVAEWNKFLDSKLRADDSAEFQCLIADALLKVKDECLAELSYYSSWWFKDHFKKLIQFSCGITEQLLDKLVDVIKRYPQCCNSAVSANRDDRDWIMEAINSCVGRVAEAIVASYFSEDGLDKRNHLNRLEQLLAQRGTIRQHTLTILSQNLVYFFRKDTPWTEGSIISALQETETFDGQAAWSGFLWNPRVDDKLFPRLKPGLLKMAKRQAGFRRGHLHSISGLLLLGWLPNTASRNVQQITNEELHDAILSGGPEFRTQILWHLQRDLSNSPKLRDSLLPSVVTLLTQVWPKEIEVRSPAFSASLLDMLMVDETVFGNLINVALPFFTTLTQEQRYHFHFQEENIKPVIDGNPERFLALLVKILPEEPDLWPYGFGNTLQMILTADPILKNDSRFESLQQRWNKRW